MNITEIRITKLYGLFDHSIQLNTEDHITVIFGPNGIGKTAILRLIYGVFDLDHTDLWKIPFGELMINFEGGSKLSVTLNQELKNASDAGFLFSSKNSVLSKYLLFKWNENGSIQEYRVSESDQRYGTRSNHIFLWESGFSSEKKSEPPIWYRNILGKVKTKLISTERLRLSSKKKVTSAVAYYSKDLTQIIAKILGRYAEQSQALDRTFPKRLLDKNLNVPEFTALGLRNELSKLESKRKILTEAGLLDESDEGIQTQIDDTTVDKHTLRLLSVYAEDVKKKLSVFDDVAKKIELLNEIIKKRFKYKRLEINKQKGFVIKSSSGTEISPELLSSGEQHELILLYEMLFRFDNGALILIDEPEISFHVEWQHEFLEDLSKIVKLCNYNVIIATHSPQIINDHWDLTSELKGLSET